jgi:tetratricopeptide (TPR) repeat protein
MKAVFLTAAIVVASGSSVDALTEGTRLAAVYDAILDARFEEAEAELARVCPPAPEGACQTLRVISLWWQIQINPESRALDRRFTGLANATIDANEAWTRLEPKRAEAWFYLAGAYAPRVQWRVLRGERIGAARDGKRIKDALERALELDPSLHDAHFGIGLYHYYADVAPTAARILRWLLLLPGGDRVRGLQEMLQARDRGELIKGEADFQLHLVYVWYEKRPADAIALLESLDARHAGNPLFLERLAAIRHSHLRDYAGSVAAWQRLLGRAQKDEVAAPRATEVRARLGLAFAFSAMNRRDEAIAQLQRIVDTRPSEPIGALERAERELRAMRERRTQQ